MGAVKLAAVGVIIVGVAIVAVRSPDRSPESEPPRMAHGTDAPAKRRPDTPDGRKELVKIVAKRLPKATISTEGSESEGLVIDLKNCYEEINRLLDEPEFIARLDQFQFKWLRCPSASLKITPPWR